MRALNSISVALGLWLIVVAVTLSAGSSTLMIQEFVLGVITAVFAWQAARRERNVVSSWIVAAAGLWTALGAGLSVVSYRGYPISRTNDIVVGIVVAVLGVSSALFRESPVRTSRDNYYRKA